MKKIIVVLIAAFVIFSVMPSQADAATKYVKIKKTTYQKYKKAYKNQASLKSTISKQNSTISSQKTTIANQKAQIAELNGTIKDKKSTISWLWGTLEEFGYAYNYDTHKWESTSPSIKISKDTLEIEQRGFILISFNGKAINTNSGGYYVYSDSLTFDPDTQTYSGEEVHGQPYKEFYGDDYELVVDYNIGHQMYLDYINK